MQRLMDRKSLTFSLPIESFQNPKVVLHWFSMQITAELLPTLTLGMAGYT